MFSTFIARPIFAGVISAIIVLSGLASIPTLPITEYPQIAPPSVVVTSTYTGADAQTVEAAVTVPLEEQINGVPGLRYLSSTSSDAGVSTVTATFVATRNVDEAAVDVQNRVQNAQGRLPSIVLSNGIAITKSSGSFVMAVSLTSHGVPLLGLSNYADRFVRDALLRVPGVSDVRIFGERKYSMRIWYDPHKLQFYDLTDADIRTALAAENAQVPAGAIGNEPSKTSQASTYSVQVDGALANSAAFGNIVVKHGTDAGLVRLRQVARVELGAESYATRLAYNGQDTIGLGITQTSDANSLNVARGVRNVLDGLRPTFPPGVDYAVPYDTTRFVAESVREVVATLVEAIALVVLTIFFFLQDSRTTLIPVVTIPVSLIGTFAFVNVFGFSINTLVLFGVTLATGLVVDDAIVVVENISRVVQAGSGSNIAGDVSQGLIEIAGAVIATSLVLLAVFVPVAFLSGTTGELYRQFALTIAFSVALSAVVALTFAPALAAKLMRRSSAPSRFIPFVVFNRGFNSVQRAYDAILPTVLSKRYAVAVALFAVLGATWWLLGATPTGFIPDEDQGLLIGSIQAPEGSSLNVVKAAATKFDAIARRNPDVASVLAVSGLSFAGESANEGIVFVSLKPWAQRAGESHSAAAIVRDLTRAVANIPEAAVRISQPPAIQGIGTVGGFQFEVEDHGSGSVGALATAANRIVAAANRDPRLASVYTTFRASGPKVSVVVNRAAVRQLGLAFPDVYSALQASFGSAYINDFTLDGRSYRVFLEADWPFRSTPAAIGNLMVRSDSNALVPLSSVVRASAAAAPSSLSHYDLFRSVEINGVPAPGRSTGEALAAMESIAAAELPSGFGYEWSGLSLEEKSSGKSTMIIFVLALMVVFLVLAAQYESLTEPIIILLAVPVAMFGALASLQLRGLQNDVYAQIGLVLLIGLSAKNAILIVEFANQQRDAGKTLAEAAASAAQTRLRPILMTSVAFILGLLPLVFASGAGSASRHSLGTAVVGGMLVSTVLNLLVVPAMYVVVEQFFSRNAKTPSLPTLRSNRQSSFEQSEATKSRVAP